MIYLDHAASAHRRPPEVREAMLRFLDRTAANPGRSGHRLSIAAAEVVYAAREVVAELVGASDPLRVIFGANATEALNQAIFGLVRPGDHVVTSSIEHNSVMRPLRALEGRGVEVTVVPCAGDGALDPADLTAAVREGTRLVVLNHASNVAGTVLPVAEAGRIARARGALLLVDAAQTAGAWPIDLEADNIDLLALTGHKSLLGPMGTGALVIGERVEGQAFEPLKHGGTGSRSEHEVQPDFLPDRLESGTPNAMGLAGLAAGVRWLLDRGVAAVRKHEAALLARLLDGLRDVPQVTIFGPADGTPRTAVVSFNLEGQASSEVGLRLDDEFDVLCRVGLHCSPAAHRTLGTHPHGTVRFSIGAFTTADEIDRALEAVRAIAGSER